MNEVKKNCLGCSQVLPITEFHKKGKLKSGKLKISSYCKKCTHQQYLEYYYQKGGQAQHKKYHIEKKYGLSEEDYSKLLEDQNHQCKICGTVENTNGTLYVDHCHQTNKVRGLLCNKCNQGLGYFNDDEQLLLSAVRYLSVDA